MISHFIKSASQELFHKRMQMQNPQILKLLETFRFACCCRNCEIFFLALSGLLRDQNSSLSSSSSTCCLCGTRRNCLRIAFLISSAIAAHKSYFSKVKNEMKFNKKRFRLCFIAAIIVRLARFIISIINAMVKNYHFN